MYTNYLDDTLHDWLRHSAKRHDLHIRQPGQGRYVIFGPSGTIVYIEHREGCLILYSRFVLLRVLDTPQRYELADPNSLPRLRRRLHDLLHRAAEYGTFPRSMV